MDEVKKSYFKLLFSGMFFQLFPNLMGEWDKDKDKWTDIHNKINSNENK